MPAVLSSATRVLSFVIPVFWLAAQPQFHLAELWYVSVASMTLQAVVSLVLLRRQFQRQLRASPPPEARSA